MNGRVEYVIQPAHFIDTIVVPETTWLFAADRAALLAACPEAAKDILQHAPATGPCHLQHYPPCDGPVLGGARTCEDVEAPAWWTELSKENAHA